MPRTGLVEFRMIERVIREWDKLSRRTQMILADMVSITLADDEAYLARYRRGHRTIRPARSRPGGCYTRRDRYVH